MRRVVLSLAAAGLALPGAGVPVSVADPAPGGFMSTNVTWVANLPLDSPGIGGRVLQVGGQRRFYVTGAKGLSIYDVTNPGLPLVLATLPMPHFENESVAVSDDGSTVILANDPGFGQPPLTYVVDASLVNAPHVVGVIPEGAHTTTCANAACTHLYSDNGWIYDIRDRANPKPAGSFPGAAHYLSRDAAGLLWDGASGSSEHSGSMLDPRRDPTKPVRIKVGTGGWHNSLRPNADRWRPRRPGDRSPLLKPGELHIGGAETWLANSCPGAALTTWSIVDFDKGKRARKISTIRPRSGRYLEDGNPPANVGGCSSHWFDYRAGMVAAGWYDHGVRFVKVDERTGVATEAGYFQPVNGETWAAYWIDDEYVYSVDAVRGIDILRFNRTAPGPSESELDGSWRPSLFPPSAATVREQYLCRLAARNDWQ